MKKTILWVIVFLTASVIEARAENLRDLSERVRDLERTVERLQERCAGCSDERYWADEEPIVWTCTVSGGKELFYGNGETKGLAEREAMEACKAKANVCRVRKCSDE